jgi:UTP--glucose-1-phosphate uridylyltransferase
MQSVYAYEFKGKRYDTGDKVGYVKAIIDFALKNPLMKEEISEYIVQVAREDVSGFFRLFNDTEKQPIAVEK